ncbi:MBL fold metallo-hydrolase [Microbacterium aerolatum]|nr:MBL fold metallo-hydrolase [Microbacterium aerolatum]
MIATSAQQYETWSRREVPAFEQAADDVWAVPVPVARIPIRFTYAYLIRSRGQAVLIDPGAGSPEGAAALTEALDAIGIPVRSLTGIVVTHYHFDHWEAADELAQQSGAWIAIGADEQGWVDDLTDDDVSLETATRRFQAHGVPMPRAVEFASVEDYRYTRDHVRPSLLLRHGDLLPLEGASLRALSTPGHSPGHVCIHDEQRGMLFSGDHILPGITPHIALNPFGSPDPLDQYLRSLEVVEQLGNVEVMPAHEYRFSGLGLRTQALRDDVARRVHEVSSVLEHSPRATAWEVASALTWSRSWSQFGVEAQRMAVVETAAFIAHVRQRR